MIEPWQQAIADHQNQCQHEGDDCETESVCTQGCRCGCASRLEDEVDEKFKERFRQNIQETIKSWGNAGGYDTDPIVLSVHKGDKDEFLQKLYEAVGLSDSP